MIFESFLRWVETAGTQKRVEAASALGRAYCHTKLDDHHSRAARLAMTCLLDDPSPKVRMSLAEAIADAPNAPRPVIMTLAGDLSQIAAIIVSRSPVLDENDLIEIVGKADSNLRIAIAIRSGLTRPVVASLAEVGRWTEIMVLLQNESAQFSSSVFLRLAERAGDVAPIRELLLGRTDLPAAARQVLIEKLATALSTASLVKAAVPAGRLSKMCREACDTAVINVIASARDEEMLAVTEHLRKEGRLTIAFLIQTLGAGRTTFFAQAIANLSGVALKRARSILASGRMRAVRALIESAGVGRDLSPVFCHAVEIWRQGDGDISGIGGIFSELAERCRNDGHLEDSARSLVDFIDRLAVIEMRQIAHNYAQDLVREAA